MSVMKRSTIAAALLLGSLGAATVWSAEQPRYKSPDPDISHVEFGGVWTEGKHSGQYRAVVRTDCAGDDCYDELFVERLEPVGSKRILVGAKRVAQIGARKQILNMDFVQVRSGENFLEVEHREGADRSNDRWTLCLALDGPNRYASYDGRCRR
jgi:hypothetical protein